VLSQAGLIGSNWNRDAFGGMVTDSIVVFVVRKGNPKNIKTWNDLIKPGIQVINANPFTSGGARWNVMAAWGAQIKQHKTPAQASQYLKALYKNISVQDSSARASMNTFVQGKGDVLLAYENEAIQAQQAGADIQFVRPSATILIENPIAVLKGTHNPTQAKAFVDFTRSAAAQDIWAQYGYRPIVRSVFKKWSKTFPVPRQLFTIRDVVKGGWPVVQPKFFDPNSGIVKQIQGT
jgi:sulfate/thiosulfate transport system substrate-binding protein